MPEWRAMADAAAAALAMFAERGRLSDEIEEIWPPDALR
jgi:hypothetical protein